MKTIRELNAPTPGLADYLACVGDDPDWAEFRSHGSGASYSELRDALTENQHGLCAYCEVALGNWRRQVEHVILRSDVRLGGAKALDIANMLASCMGGTLEVRLANEDEALYRKPVARNMSCGQAKGERHDERFIDPRMLPVAPPLARVFENGNIEVDEDACRSADVPAGHMARTVEILNLNADRLRLARERLWASLVEVSGAIEGEEEMDAWVRSALKPDENGLLAPFFTTTRCYFAPLSERILEDKPQSWI